MADLVRHDIVLCEIPRRLEALLQHLVETQIDVDGLVLGTVERSGGRLSEAAGRLRSAAEHHQLGRSVLGAPLAEDLGPCVLGAGEHGRHEAGARIGLRHALFSGSRRRGGLHRRPSIDTADQTEDLQGVDAQYPAAHQRQENRTDSDAAPAHPYAAESPALSPAVLDVVALPFVLPAHPLAPYRSGTLLSYLVWGIVSIAGEFP